MNHIEADEEKNEDHHATINSLFDAPFRAIQRSTIYSRVEQRQKWGEKQILPRVNWGDLFFDLFYVAAGYNATNILEEEPTGRGILYFLATFLSAMDHWLCKLVYDGRYALPDDLSHRGREIVHLCMLSAVVLHIRPVSIMADSVHNVDTFSFCLANAIGHFCYILDNVELYFFGRGEILPMRATAMDQIRRRSVSTLFYLAAAIYAGIIFYSNNNESMSAYHDDDHYSSTEYYVDSGGYRMRWLAEPANTTTHNTSTADYYNNDDDHAYDGNTNDHHVYDTAYGDYDTSEYYADVPIILCLVAHVVNWLSLVLNVFFCIPKGEAKERVIPINVDFVIHRSGEWTMLMLGESLLSILISESDGDSSNYWQTMLCALTTVLLLKYLHFTSQPHHADQHAMRRSKYCGILWTIFQQVYSVAYLGLSCSFGLFLSSLTTSSSYGGSLTTYDDNNNNELLPAARLFSGSLALIFFSIDVMNLLHLGVRNSIVRMKSEATNEFNFIGMIVILLRFGTIVFVGTLGLWQVNPWTLSLIGLFSALFQLLLRKFGYMYLVAGQQSAVTNIRSSMVYQNNSLIR